MDPVWVHGHGLNIRTFAVLTEESIYDISYIWPTKFWTVFIFHRVLCVDKTGHADNNKKRASTAGGLQSKPTSQSPTDLWTLLASLSFGSCNWRWYLNTQEPRRSDFCPVSAHHGSSMFNHKVAVPQSIPYFIVYFYLNRTIIYGHFLIPHLVLQPSPPAGCQNECRLKTLDWPHTFIMVAQFFPEKHSWKLSPVEVIERKNGSNSACVQSYWLTSR